MIAWQQSNSNTSLIRQLADISGDLIHLSPEIAIVATLLMLLAFDLIFKNKKEVGLAAIGFTGLFATLAILVYSWTAEPEGEVVMNGFLRYDQLAIFLKILFVIGAISGLLIASQCKKKSLFRSGESMVILMGLVLGAFLMSAANNLLILYLSVETVSICSYLLTGLLKGKKRAEASLKYLLFGAVSSAVMLYGISWLYGFTGSLDFMNPAFAEALAGIAPLPLGIAMVMFLGGLIFKLGAVPFHVWSPDVYEAAPTSIVAIFSALPKLAGLVLLFRVTQALPPEIFDWQLVLGVVAIASMTFGNFSALWQRDVKRLMAYSSIAHAGFLLVGLLAYSESGKVAMLFYASIYLVMNAAAFLLIKLVERKTGSSHIDAYRGLGNRLPYLGVLFVIVMIALTGLPPTVGFNAKLYVFSAIWESGQALGKTVLFWVFLFGLLNTAVALFYYLKVPYFMFFKSAEADGEVMKMTWSQKLWGTILVLPLLLWFFQSNWLMEALNNINFVF